VVSLVHLLGARRQVPTRIPVEGRLVPLGIQKVGRGRTVSRVRIWPIQTALSSTGRHLTTRGDTMRLGTKWVLVPESYSPPLVLVARARLKAAPRGRLMWVRARAPHRSLQRCASGSTYPNGSCRSVDHATSRSLASMRGSSLRLFG